MRPADAADGLDRAGRFSGRVLILFATQVFGTGLGIFNGILLAKLLGPALKGDYYLVVLLPATIMVILQLGLPPALGYYSARDQVRRIIAKALLLMTILSSVGIAAAVVALPILEETILRGPTREQILVGYLAIPITLTASFMTAIVIGRQAVGWNLIANALGSITSTLALVLLVGLLDLQIWGAVIAFLLSGVAQAAGYLAGARNVVDAIPTPAAVSFRQLFRYALPYYPGSITSFFSYRFDVYLLAGLLADPSAPLGYYSMAVSFAALVFFFPEAVSSLFFPHVAGSSRADSDRQVGLVARVTFLVSLAGGLALIPAAYLLIHIVLPAFEPTLGALLILLPGVIALSVSNVLTGYVTGLGYTGVTSVINIGAFALNVAVNLVLIPRFGIYGASAASLVSYTATSLAYTVVASRLSGAAVLAFWVPRLADLRYVLATGLSLARRVLSWVPATARSEAPPEGPG